MIEVLSLGAGVQSSCVFLMSCKGVLPKLDAAVFADTQWEPSGVYENVKWLTEQGEAAGIPVHVVTAGNLRQSLMQNLVKGDAGGGGQRFASIPFYIANEHGKVVMARRQCTREYKIEPVERFIRRELLGLKKGQRAPTKSVNHWFGISSDELRRVRISKNRWQGFIYPLCGLPDPMLPKPMARRDCLEWLDAEYPGRNFPRSACIGCPYRSNAEWRSIRDDPAAWADAIEVDEAIRDPYKMDGEAFLHRSLVPLKVAEIRSDEERGQGTFWGDECLGMCGN